MSTYFWDLGQFSLIFGAFPIKGGAGEGGFFKAEKTEDDFTTIVGVDGSVTRYKTGHPVWRCSIICKQKSPINTILTGLRTIDLGASNGAGAVPLIGKDGGGLDIMMWGSAWIVKPPTVEITNAQKDREWLIDAVETVIVLGT